MLKPPRYSVITFAVALALSACSQDAGNAVAAPVKVEGVLTEASYKQAGAQALAQARQVMSDRALTEKRLDAAVAKIEQLLPLADKLGVDKAKLDEAELVSTLGALYARKAGFYANQAQQAGIYSAKGFRYLDRAIAKYPDNLTARLNRGMTSAKVPEFMNKSTVARDDLRFVLNLPEFADLPPGLKASVRTALDEVERRLASVDRQS